MKPLRGRVLPVLLAATVLVGGANLAAYAATGTPLLLGSSNAETRTATVANRGTGPALSLRSRAGAPPLAVSNTTKVTRLNADLVDGLDSSKLRSRTFVYRLPDLNAVTGFRVSLPGLPRGTFIGSYSVVASSSGAGGINCYFRTTTNTTGEGLGYAAVQAGFTTASGTAVVHNTALDQLELTCFSSGGNLTTDPDTGSISSITLTSVGRLTGPATATQLARQAGAGPSAR